MPVSGHCRSSVYSHEAYLQFWYILTPLVNAYMVMLSSLNVGTGTETQRHQCKVNEEIS